MDRSDVTPNLVKELLDYNPETGKLLWRKRRQDMFSSKRIWKIWNTRFSGKEAGTVGHKPRANTPYFVVRLFKMNFLAHRIAWALHHGDWPENQIDHINGDGLDNRIVNLADKTQAENRRNVPIPANNTSGVVGVAWRDFANGWIALIGVKGRTKYLGTFKTKEDAIAARKAAERKYGFHPNHGRKVA